MAINVSCPSCSRSYSIPEQHAGRRFKCKQCQAPITVPALEEEFEDFEDDDAFLSGLNEATSQARRSEALPPAAPAALPSAKKKPAVKKKQASGSNFSVLRVIGGIGGAIIGFIIVIGIVGRIMIGSIPSDTSTWVTVPLAANVSCKMPSTPNGKPGDFVGSSGKRFNRPNEAWLASVKDMPVNRTFELDELISLRDMVVKAGETNAQLGPIRAVGEPTTINGNWAFRLAGTRTQDARTVHSESYYVLLPNHLVTLEFLSRSENNEAHALRFFETLNVPAGTIAASATPPSPPASSDQPVASTQDASSAAHGAESASNPDAASSAHGADANYAAQMEAAAAANTPQPNSADSTITMNEPGFEFPEGSFPEGALPEGAFPEGSFPDGPVGPPSGGGFNPLSFLPPAPSARPDGSPTYQEFRKTFRTQLVQRGPAPQPFEESELQPGVRKVEYKSGSMNLVGYEYRGDATPRDKRPALLFLHGGFACDPNELLVVQPFIDAGFVVFAPTYRGENGNPGEFTLFCDEVVDAAGAATWLASQRYVDKDHVYCLGHSAGGGVAALLSLLDNVPLHSTASVGGLYSKDAFMGGGLPTPFTPSDDEIRARTLFGNTPDMTRQHYAYAGLLDIPMVISIGQINADIAVNGGRQPLFKAEYVGGDHFTSFDPGMRKYLDICMADAGIDASKIKWTERTASTSQSEPPSTNPFKPSGESSNENTSQANPFKPAGQ